MDSRPDRYGKVRSFLWLLSKSACGLAAAHCDKASPYRRIPTLTEATPPTYEAEPH